jgi:REP element-mobilizing transposase RayT
MPNHFHPLIQQQETSISTIMRSLVIRYAAHFNRLKEALVQL